MQQICQQLQPPQAMKYPLVNRRLAKILTILQAIMIVVAAIIGWIGFGAIGAKSAALGASVYWLASAFFAWQTFTTAGARASKQVLGNMYVGIIGKFVIVIVGLSLVLTAGQPINFLALLGGLVLVQIMAWVAPFCIK